MGNTPMDARKCCWKPADFGWFARLIGPRTVSSTAGKPSSIPGSDHPGAAADDHVVLIRITAGGRPGAAGAAGRNARTGRGSARDGPPRARRGKPATGAALAAALRVFHVAGILHERMPLVPGERFGNRQQDLDSGEQIEPLVTPWDEAMTLVDSGQIQDAKTIGRFCCSTIESAENRRARNRNRVCSGCLNSAPHAA